MNNVELARWLVENRADLRRLNQWLCPNESCISRRVVAVEYVDAEGARALWCRGRRKVNVAGDMSDDWAVPIVDDAPHVRVNGNCPTCHSGLVLAVGDGRVSIAHSV